MFRRSRIGHVRRRGVALIYATVSMIVLLGVAALAVDLGAIAVTKSQLSTAVDAACSAGCAGLAVSPADARSRAKAAAAQNLVNGRALTLLDSDIELGTWNSTTGAFTVLTGAAESTATAIRINGSLALARGTQLNLFFLPVIGAGRSVDLRNSSVGTSSSGSADIILIQDVSTSFREEIADAKAGDRALLNALNAADNTSSFGIVVFSGYSIKHANLQTISGNHSTLVNKINSMRLAGNWGMPEPSGTDIASGIERAQTMFNNYTSLPQASRAMIIVSDGEPSAYWLGAHWPMNNTQLMNLARQDADTAWAAGIHVYVVFFNRDNNQTAANNLRSLIRGKGVFVQVTNPADLPDAIGGIAQRLPSKLVK